MLEWVKRILQGDDAVSDKCKNFDEAIQALGGVSAYRKLGTQSIPTEKIVGSVDRADELGSNFRYRNRSVTDRYHRIDEAIQSGAPMDPIKVVRVKRERNSTEYYVMDGHHRVAQAKKHGFDEMNADVTDAIPNDSDADETSTDAT